MLFGPVHGGVELKGWKCFICFRFEFSSKMREACLILRNHLNDDARALKSKEVVRACMLLKASSHSHSYLH